MNTETRQNGTEGTGAASALSAGLGLRAEQHRDGRLAALEALAIVETENKRLRDIIDEIHAWAVCYCIATPEDMMQNMPRVVEITSPNV